MSEPPNLNPPVPGQGLVNVEQQRAVAEVQAMLIVARSVPRDPVRARDLIIQDCQSPKVAEEALYDYARGGTEITGPTIRLLEVIVRRWGNMETGVKELSRENGVSQCLAFAWDLETNWKDSRLFHTKHWRDTKGGGYRLTDERDIYEAIANVGARRKRACMEAIVPRDVVDAAVAQCDKTMKSTADCSAEAMKKMVEAFAAFGVTREQIEKRIQRRLDSIQPAQVVSLKKIYASLRDGMSAARDWFEMPQATAESSDLNERLQTKAKASKPPPPEPESKVTEPGGQPPPQKP